MKIGEQKQPEKNQKSRVRQAAETALLVGTGTATGQLMASLIGRQLTKNRLPPPSLGALKIILPILTSTAVVLGNELRRMSEERNKKAGGSDAR